MFATSQCMAMFIGVVVATFLQASALFSFSCCSAVCSRSRVPASLGEPDD